MVEFYLFDQRTTRTEYFIYFELISETSSMFQRTWCSLKKILAKEDNNFYSVDVQSNYITHIYINILNFSIFFIDVASGCLIVVASTNILSSLRVHSMNMLGSGGLAFSIIDSFLGRTDGSHMAKVFIV